MSDLSLFDHLKFAIKYAVRSLIERSKTWLFYGIPHRMIGVEMGFFLQYPIRSPNQISRRYMRGHGNNTSLVFGETPLTALEKICRQAKIPPGKVIFDVGCGCGRSTFFLHKFNRAHRTIGIDIIPQFIHKAETIRKWTRLDYMVFLKADIRKIDYQDADIIYLYGTCFSPELISDLVALWEVSLKDDTMIITTSKSLCSFSEQNRIQLQEQCELDYIWGICPVFFHVVRSVEPETM